MGVGFAPIAHPTFCAAVTRRSPVTSVPQISTPSSASDVTVRRHGAVRQLLQRVPHALLERRPGDAERDLEGLTPSGEILLHLVGYLAERVGVTVGRVQVPSASREPHLVEALLVRDECQRTHGLVGSCPIS